MIMQFRCGPVTLSWSAREVVTGCLWGTPPAAVAVFEIGWDVVLAIVLTASVAVIAVRSWWGRRKPA